RLTEEGVEDMQNLTTMNLVDVILHTRVPPGRLVDWTDQAFLLTHLERTDRAELNQLRQADKQADQQADWPPAAGRAPLSGAQARLNLRRVGIRTATDLLKAFSVERDNGERAFRLPEGLEPPLPPDQLRLLVTVLAAEPGLSPVWNWQRNGVQPAAAAHYRVA
ncbi:MAG TPA: hypothetical protein VMK84_34510, partial [Streptosporangiaceae bacterium]|nr:hypothetical protein [Streptosporangiaceae bacterium]